MHLVFYHYHYYIKLKTTHSKYPPLTIAESPSSSTCDDVILTSPARSVNSTTGEEVTWADGCHLADTWAAEIPLLILSSCMTASLDCNRYLTTQAGDTLASNRSRKQRPVQDFCHVFGHVFLHKHIVVSGISFGAQWDSVKSTQNWRPRASLSFVTNSWTGLSAERS